MNVWKIDIFLHILQIFFIKSNFHNFSLNNEKIKTVGWQQQYKMDVLKVNISYI